MPPFASTGVTVPVSHIVLEITTRIKLNVTFLGIVFAPVALHATEPGATPAISHLPLSDATFGLNSTSFAPLQRPVVTSKLSHSFIERGLTLKTDGVAYAPNVHLLDTLLLACE